MPTVNFDAIPQEMRDVDRWVLWALETRDGKPTKVPYQCWGKKASSTDPSTWHTFDAVRDLYENSTEFSGIGFMLGDNWLGLDFDKSVKDAEIQPFAKEILEIIWSYTELSPSRTGLHAICYGEKPGKRARHFDAESGVGVELYDKARFLTVTGDWVEGFPKTVENRQDEIVSLYHILFPLEDNSAFSGTNMEQLQGTSGGLGEIITNDAELIEIIRKDKNGPKFTRLWGGNTEGYESPSQADIALCNILAFSVGDHPQRIFDLFSHSGLVREKWFEKRGDTTYGMLTVRNAIREVGKRGFRKHAGDTRVGIVGIGADKPVDTRVLDEIEDGEEIIKYTDGWRAKQLFRLHSENLKWIHEKEKFYAWRSDKGVWSPDDDGISMRMAREVTVEMLDNAKILKADDPHDSKVKAAELISEARKADTNAKYNAMHAQYRPLEGVTISINSFDKPSMLLNVENGIVDLTTGDLLPHNRSHYLSKQAPVKYNENAECPYWLDFLHKIMKGKGDMVDFLQRAIGYSITGDISEQVLFIMHGGGSNGKSTFTRCLFDMLGDYSISSRDNLLISKDNSDDAEKVASSLVNQRFVLAPELKSRKRLDSEFIKRITGGDKITARFLFQEPFEFYPTHKIWAYANTMPKIDDTDDGLWRRIMKIPFDYKFNKGEAISFEKVQRTLAKEWSGILMWAIEGCLSWSKNGLMPPEDVVKSTGAFRESSDVLGQFLNETIEVIPDERVQSTILYDLYTNWCRGMKSFLSYKDFSNDIESRGHAKVKSSCMYFENMQLLYSHGDEKTVS